MIYQPIAAALLICVPPVRSGKEELEKLEDLVVGSIALLKEHRFALISAAVTGKIDVSTRARRDEATE